MILINTIILLVVCFIFIALYSKFYQKKLWNKGICKDCNTDWIKFTEQPDAKCYVCKCKNNFLWITWKGIDTE
jgi:hypothetical protein